MEIAINEAKGKLSGLINAALNGEHIVLTKHGRPVAEIKPLATVKKPADKLAALQEIAARAALKKLIGVDAAHSSDFLYGNDGLPK